MSDVLQRLCDSGLIAVVRADHPELVPPACAALVEGGVIALEITCTVPAAARVLATVREQCGAAACVGAGSVLNPPMAEEMIQAGAAFIVSPVTCPVLVQVGHDADCPVMLGAYSPTEILRAHDAGADLVKVFPADQLGPAYIRAVRAPMPHLRLVPTGGVDLSNAAAFLEAGCVALGLGSSLLAREIMSRQDWPALSGRARAFVDIHRKHRARQGSA